MQMTIIEPTAAPEIKRKIRVGAYCRVSTDASDQKHSFNAQKMHFSMLYANSANYELVDIYADMGISGTKAAFRPEFQRMLDDARCGKIDRVVCKSISRFARNTKECLMALRELKHLNVSVAFEKENIDTARISDEIMITIMEGLAQEESASISRNVRWSLTRKMASGTLVVARVPYGYKKNEKRQLIIDEPKAAVVRRIYDFYLSGIGGKRIAALLNEEGLPSPTGKLWNDITVKKILKQEKYIGDIHWQKTYSVFMVDHLMNHGDVDSYYIENAHPAIIDKETFYLAQRIREETAEKVKPKQVRKDTLFRGKIRCTCGRSYYRVTAKNDYWECIGRKMLGAGCTNHVFYHDELLDAWRRMCFKLRNHADEILSPVLIQLELMEKAVRGTETTNLQEQANDLRQRRYMLCKLCAEGCLERKKMLIAENELESELQDIESKIERINSFSDDTADEIETVYRAVNTAAPERLVDLILDYAVVDGKSITFHLIGGLHFREVL